MEVKQAMKLQYTIKEMKIMELAHRLTNYSIPEVWCRPNVKKLAVKKLRLACRDWRWYCWKRRYDTCQAPPWTYWRKIGCVPRLFRCYSIALLPKESLHLPCTRQHHLAIPVREPKLHHSISLSTNCNNEFKKAAGAAFKQYTQLLRLVRERMNQMKKFSEI